VGVLAGLGVGGAMSAGTGLLAVQLANAVGAGNRPIAALAGGLLVAVSGHLAARQHARDAALKALLSEGSFGAWATMRLLERATAEDRRGANAAGSVRALCEASEGDETEVALQVAGVDAVARAAKVTAPSNEPFETRVTNAAAEAQHPWVVESGWLVTVAGACVALLWR
jgi:hypothetical protein